MHSCAVGHGNGNPAAEEDQPDSSRDRKAVGYIRISSATQLDGYGLEAQERDLKKCAEALGLKLSVVLRDEGISGSLEAVDRPGLAEALSMIESGEVSVLLVSRLDRLAR